MKRLIVLGAGAVGAMTLSTVLLGTGVAAAAEYDGQTYADAAAAIEESGGTPIVATRIGSQLPQDECIVVNSRDHSYLRDPLDDVYVQSVTDEVRLSLNCAGTRRRPIPVPRGKSGRPQGKGRRRRGSRRRRARAGRRQHPRRVVVTSWSDSRLAGAGKIPRCVPAAVLSPRIAPNTGNAIRMVAATGCELHLVEPLGFDLSEPKLRRAGLDYHDLASVTVHRDLLAAWEALAPTPVYRVHRACDDVVRRHRLPTGRRVDVRPRAHRTRCRDAGRSTHHRAGAHPDAGGQAVAEPVQRRGRRRLRGLAPTRVQRGGMT